MRTRRIQQHKKRLVKYKYEDNLIKAIRYSGVSAFQVQAAATYLLLSDTFRNRFKALIEDAVKTGL